MLNKTQTITGSKSNGRQTCQKMIAILIAAACIGFASAASRAEAKEQKSMTDTQITNAVDQMFINDGVLQNNLIDTKVKDGIVTLSGTSNTLIDRERAAKIAETVIGVRGIVNTVEVKAPARQDEEIRKDISLGLSYDAATSLYKIEPKVKNGGVTLGGTVESYREKQLILDVAKSVRGVKDVKDGIVVKSTIERPDAVISAEVKNAIAIDVWLEQCLIITKVKDGIVTLTGVVGSAAQQPCDRAGMDCRSVFGERGSPEDRAVGQAAGAAGKHDQK